MWTIKNRGRYDRSKLRYPSDLTDDEWGLVEPLIPPGKRGGGKRTVIMREVVNGLMYILSTGCQWRAIPKDLPPRSSVYDYFDLWTYDGTLGRIHHALYEQCREREQREASPTAAIIDSQSVKSAEKDAMGQRRDSCKIVASINLQLTEPPMQKPHDNSKASPAAFVQDNTLIAPGKTGGGKRTVIMREVVNGLMYVLSTGCQWRAIPKDLPPKSSVYDYFDLWTYDGTLERIHHALYEQCREREQREASPTAAIIDSQSVKSAEKGGRALIRTGTMRARRSRARSGTFLSIQ